MLENYKFELEDIVDFESSGLTSYYFRTDKKILDDMGIEYDEETSFATLHIEMPTDDLCFDLAEVSISATIEEDDETEDVDWNDIEISEDEFQYLMKDHLMVNTNEIEK